MPASLIPICSYQSNITMLGRKHNDLNFTLCDSFKQIIHKGQLCYSLKLNNKNHPKSKIGKNNGLLLILDPQLVESEENKNPGKDVSGDNAGHATISLDTLAPFSDNQEGNYALTDLKWMSGTESFMELSNEEKECQIETFEECQGEKLKERCECVPWQLMFNVSKKKDQVWAGGEIERINKDMQLILYYPGILVIYWPMYYPDTWRI